MRVRVKYLFLSLFLKWYNLKESVFSFIFRPYEGHIEESTEMRNQYQGLKAEKPIKAKSQNNLKPYTGKLDTLTEHRDRFIPKELDNRANKIRPTTTIIREGTVGQKLLKYI